MNKNRKEVNDCCVTVIFGITTTYGQMGVTQWRRKCIKRKGPFLREWCLSTISFQFPFWAFHDHFLFHFCRLVTATQRVILQSWKISLAFLIVGWHICGCLHLVFFLKNWPYYKETIVLVPPGWKAQRLTTWLANCFDSTTVQIPKWQTVHSLTQMKINRHKMYAINFRSR